MLKTLFLAVTQKLRILSESYKIGLVKGQNFSLHYDFGDDWMFTIHVQKTEEETGKTKPEIIKSVGNLEQYPDYDEW